MNTNEQVRFSLRKNDQVQVIAGREKGKNGKILRLHPKTGRVTVEKVNLVKRHIKPSAKYPQGGILEKELPLHVSNVLLHCPKCNRGVRHGHKVMEQTARKASKKKDAPAAKTKQIKVRFCKRCNETLDAA